MKKIIVALGLSLAVIAPTVMANSSLPGGYTLKTENTTSESPMEFIMSHNGVCSSDPNSLGIFQGVTYYFGEGSESTMPSKQTYSQDDLKVLCGGLTTGKCQLTFYANKKGHKHCNVQIGTGVVDLDTGAVSITAGHYPVNMKYNLNSNTIHVINE